MPSPDDLPGMRTDPRAPALIDAGASRSAALEAGKVIAGRYEIRARLGAGGMGTVYRAFDRELDEEIALKVIRPDLLGDPSLTFGGTSPQTPQGSLVERLKGEVKIARRIAHPSVCRVFDVGDDAGVAFLTMELIHGATLRSALAKGPIEPGRALTLARQITEGLAAVHQEGVIHRDLKPENVMIRGDGRAVITDFGLAKGVDRGATLTAVAGTPAYMSPEQLRGEPIDRRSDVFSLGILLFEMMTGRSPFGAGSPALVTSAILRDPPDVLRVPSLSPDLERGLSEVITRALAKAPSDRFASAAEVQSALASLTFGGTSPQTPQASLSLPEGAGSARSAKLSTTLRPAPSPRRKPISSFAALLAVPAIAAALFAWQKASPRAATTSSPLPSVALSATAPRADGALQSPSLRPSIAVAPFENLTGDAAWASAAESASEALRSGLRTVKDLDVTDPGQHPTWIASGSVQRAGDKLRFTAQIRSTDGAPASEPIEIEGRPSDVSALVDEARARALDEMKLLIDGREKRLRATRETSVEAARSALLRYYAMVGGAPRRDHFEPGKKLLDEAIAADPGYKAALVERAYLQSIGAGAKTRHERMAAAVADLDRALAEDKGHAPALVMRCRVLQAKVGGGEVTDAAIRAAMDACGAAILADPGSAHVRLAFATLYDLQCEDERAIESLERVIEIDRALWGRAYERLVSLGLANDKLPLADRTSQKLVEIQKEERRLGPRALSRRAGVLPREGVQALRGAVLIRLGRDAEAASALQSELEDTLAGTGTPWAEAAALKGLVRLAKKAGKSLDPTVQKRLADLERGYRAEADKDPSIALMVARAYSLTDPIAALPWLDRLGAAQGCDDAFDRALFYHAAGKDEAARKALSACAPKQAWETACLSRIKGKIAGP